MTDKVCRWNELNGIRALPNTVQLASMWTIAGAVISNRFNAKITPRDELSGLYWINKKAGSAAKYQGPINGVTLWQKTGKKTIILTNKMWLGREDSNLRMQEPESCVLPLDDAPEGIPSINRQTDLSGFR